MAQQPPPPVGQDLMVEDSWSHSDSPHSVGLLWMSDQPVAETFTWQHTTLTTNSHAPSGIRTHNLSRRSVADPCLRPRGHWDRWMNPSTTNYRTYNAAKCGSIRSVIDYHQAPVYKLAKSLTEMQNTFMHLKCTCSIKNSEHTHWYWQMCMNIVRIECWALHIENYVQIYQYMKWYILYPRKKYQKNRKFQHQGARTNWELTIKAPISFEWTYHTSYRSVHIP